MTGITLALVIFILAAVQPSRDRLFVALSYALLNIGHNVGVSWWADGFTYYTTAALADVVIMGLVLRVARLPEIGISLLRVCIAEIILNGAGFAAWWYSIEPVAYNTLYMFLQVWVVLILMRKDRADELGGFKVANRLDLLRLVVGAGRHSIPSRSK